MQLPAREAALVLEQREALAELGQGVEDFGGGTLLLTRFNTMTAECNMLSEQTALAGLATPGGARSYREVYLRRPEEISPLLDDVMAVLAGFGYPRQDQFAARLGLEEAIVNGLRHGNGGDPAKCVRVRCHVDAEALLAEVTDEGPGFDPDAVTDPTRPENLSGFGGRGLLLMRHFMTWVRYHGRGNRVTLCKRLMPPPCR